MGVSWLLVSLLGVGAPATPVENLDLAALLQDDIRGGERGSFAGRLSEMGQRTEVHGYLTVEGKFARPDGTSTFDLHHSTIMLRSEVADWIVAEFAAEWEHIGENFYLPFAFVDIQLSEALIVRSGYFPVPMGVFNEYLYPDFLRLTGNQPLMSRSVVPALWSEVGVQVRGRVGDRKNLEFNYAVYVVNGLEQSDANLEDDVVPEGGDIRGFRFNDRDTGSGNKGVGGRFGLATLRHLDVGVSAYTGAYTSDGERALHLFDADLTWLGQALTVRVEGALALQEVTDDTLTKYGAYGLVGYRVHPHFQPYLQAETVSLQEIRTHRGLGGVAIHPLPDRPRTVTIKAEVSHSFGDTASEILFLTQLTVGF